jgi:hypothetical protein
MDKSLSLNERMLIETSNSLYIEKILLNFKLMSIDETAYPTLIDYF